jgi:hypothetical protein
MNYVHPERIRDKNLKMDNLSDILKSKDQVIEELLNQIQ